MFHLLVLLANKLDTLHQCKMFASQKNIHHVSSPLTLSGLYMEDLSVFFLPSRTKTMGYQPIDLNLNQWHQLLFSTSTTFRPWVQLWGPCCPRTCRFGDGGWVLFGSGRCLPGGVNVLDGNIYIYTPTYSPSRELNISYPYPTQSGKWNILRLFQHTFGTHT